MITLGIDLGGTSYKLAVLRGQEMLAYDQRPTPKDRPCLQILKEMSQAALALLQRTGSGLPDVSGAGLGIPGLVDAAAGMSIFSPNLFWRNEPVVEPMRAFLGLPVRMENDVRAAAWGEYLYGAGQGTEDMVFVAVGTGIGSGIILQGRMWRGMDQCAGEIGHITLVKDGPLCNCGNHGCMETLASAPAVVRRAGEQMLRFPTILQEICQGDPGRLTAQAVGWAAAEGDELATGILKEAGEFLGLGLAAYANILNPQVIIVGGGLAQAGGVWWDTVVRTVRTRAMPVQSQVELKLAALGPNAGVIGAGALFNEQEGTSSIPC